MSRPAKASPAKTDTDPYQDMTTKSGKTTVVLNSRNYPVVVNELGQALGGGSFARVSTADKVVSRLIQRGGIYVVS